MVKSMSAGNRVMGSVRRFLEHKLRLKVNEKKSKVAPVEKCGFLGFVFVNGKIRWSDKSFLEFKRRLFMLLFRVVVLINADVNGKRKRENTYLTIKPWLKFFVRDF